MAIDAAALLTAVPVNHVGGRYGIDTKWMLKSFTGYVVEYHGLSVFFAGDTAYDARDFKRTGRTLPKLDVALLPIAPIARLLAQAHARGLDDRVDVLHVGERAVLIPR